MQYYIQQRIAGPTLKATIDHQTFLEIKKARRVLSSAFSLEEAYDLIVSNYIELEQETLRAAACEGVREDYEYNDFFILRSILNRRFVNLLSTCKSYLDQAPQFLSECATVPVQAKKDLKECLSKNYDAHFAYRFFEALRNHVQHCGLAVHSLMLNSKGTPGSRIREVSIEPIAMRKHFEEDPKFKKMVLAEIPDQFCILGHLRTYIEALGEAHGVVRTSIKGCTETARACIEATINEYARENNDATVGLAAFEYDESAPKIIETIPIFLDWDDVRLKLVQRNSTLRGLASRSIVSRGTVS